MFPPLTNVWFWFIVFIVSAVVFALTFGTVIGFIASLVGGFALGVTVGNFLSWFSSV